MKWREAFYVVLALLVLVAIFQLFFRYDYVASGGGGLGLVWRIDRLTGSACVLPLYEGSLNAPLCGPTSTPSP